MFMLHTDFNEKKFLFLENSSNARIQQKAEGNNYLLMDLMVFDSLLFGLKLSLIP